MSNIVIDPMNQRMVREVMIVTDKQILTPHYIRIYLTGKLDTIANIATMTIGVNNKVFIPVDKTQPLDLDDKAHFTIRTYTHRGIDVEKQKIWIDFIAHGDESPCNGQVKSDTGIEITVFFCSKIFGDKYPNFECNRT